MSRPPLSRRRVYSYGCIVQYKDTYLVIQNRDTEAFLFFFFASIEKWSRFKASRVFQSLCANECERLLFDPFDDIYQDLYLDRRSTPRAYDKARHNYTYLHSTPWMRHLLYHTLFTGKCVASPRFTFPKGRRERDETAEACALRECREETGLDLSIYAPVMRRCMTWTVRRPFYGFDAVSEYFHIVLDPTQPPPPIASTRVDSALRPQSVSNEVSRAAFLDGPDMRLCLDPQLYTAFSSVVDLASPPENDGSLSHHQHKNQDELNEGDDRQPANDVLQQPDVTYQPVEHMT